MPQIVILGGGIIGLSTAYYLSTFSQASASSTDDPSRSDASASSNERLEIHIVEPSETLFASASGKAAGFLAKDWFAPSVGSLGELSFDLHRKLAEEWGGREKWAWSESTGWSLDRESESENENEKGEPTHSTASTNGDESGGSGSSANSGQAAEAVSNGAEEPRTDLDWLMSGERRSILVTDPQTPSLEELLDENHPSWLLVQRSSLQPISQRTTTGQVDPLRLCQFLLERCLANGVVLHHPAKVTQLTKANSEDPNSPTLIKLEVTEGNEELLNEGGGSSIDAEASGTAITPAPTRTSTLEIRCDTLVIAAGCWTPRVYRTLFPNAQRVPSVTAMAGHSVILKSKRWPHPDATALSQTAGSVGHAIFTSDPAGFSPEIFSRVGGDIWLGGLNSSTLPLPALASDSQRMISRDAIRTLTAVAKKLCGSDIEIIQEGLCFRPVTPTGKPIIAKVSEEDLGDSPKLDGGVYIASGHGPWGISLSLGTGLVVNEMILGKEPSADVSALSRWEAQRA